MDCEQCGRIFPRGVLRDGICSECRDMIRRNEERDALRADLAQATARADALAGENAELRAAAQGWLDAADAMAAQIEELNGEYLGCDVAAQAYRRLRGGRVPEGGDE
jgi:small-conductance mechanosensitive channel